MDYHIIAFDLDGTLLAPKHRLTEYTKNVVQNLVKKGLFIVIATGRHYSEALKIKDSLGISAFLITSNGARIHNRCNKLIYSCDLDMNIVLKLIELFSVEKDVLIQLYSHDDWYVSYDHYKTSGPYSSFGFKRKLFDYQYLVNQSISKIFFTSHNVNKLLNLEKYIIRKFNNMVNVGFSCSNCLEVMSCQVSKGNALKLISNSLGFSLRNCLSFGDGMNDKDMLEMSGKGCIMKNGDPKLKSCLPNSEIIGSNTDDGVANYLYNVFF
ncbi:MAG: Cof-type HAD-IIB family hydrolase [Buchnera aphidicola (Melaphis rhois)]